MIASVNDLFRSDVLSLNAFMIYEENTEGTYSESQWYSKRTNP